jgi:hypothetical protein
VLQDLLVGLERALVVLLLVEPILRDGHPGVGDVAGARKAIEDDLEVLDRLAHLPLVPQRERIKVDDRVDLAELRVPVDELQVDRLGLLQIDGGRAARHLGALGAVGVAGRHRRLVAPHLVEVDRLRFFPVQLRQLVHRLGLLFGMRAVVQVALDQLDGFPPRGGDLGFLLGQRLSQDGRQLALGRVVVRVVVGIRFVRLARRGFGARLGGLGSHRQRQRDDERDARGPAPPVAQGPI